MPIVSSSMTAELRDDLDEFAEEHGYSGRSEVIRAACQSLLSEYRSDEYEDKEVVGTVTAVFEYDCPEIEREMMDLRHEFEESIESNAHTCLSDNAGCVETFLLEAEYTAVLSFIATLRAVDERVAVEYTAAPATEINPTLASEAD